MVLQNSTMASATLLIALLSSNLSAETQRSAAVLRYYKNPRMLSTVAHRFKLTVSQIAALNGIEDAEHFNAYGIVLPETPNTEALPRYIPWMEAPPRSPCSVKTWVFVKASKTGCEQAFCGTGSASERVCTCLSAGLVHVTLTWSAGSSTEFDVNPSIFNPFGSSMFEVADVDLDGDGSPETLVSWLEAVSNGIAQEFRSLVVFKAGQELVRYDSGEATASTAAVRIGTGCHLKSLHYEEATEPLRGPALYLVERTFDPASMRMDAELIGRRFGDTLRFVLPAEPSNEEPSVKRVVRTERGKIVAIHHDNEDNVTRLGYRVAKTTRTLKLEPFTHTGSLRLGDARSKRLFPEAIFWSGLLGQLATIELRSAGEVSVLWVGK
jgi:hypothetical protein